MITINTDYAKPEAFSEMSALLNRCVLMAGHLSLRPEYYTLLATLIQAQALAEKCERDAVLAVEDAV